MANKVYCGMNSFRFIYIYRASMLRFYLRHWMVLLVCGIVSGLGCGKAGPEVSTTSFETRQADNIILNGGFEAGKTPWWGAGELVRGAAAEGHAAIKLSGGFLAQDKRPIQGDKRYRVSMKIRSDEAPEGSIFVQLSYRGKGIDIGWHGLNRVMLEAHAEPALFVTGGNHGWKFFSVVIETPHEANELLLYLRKKAKSSGAAYYDAIEVMPSDDAVSTVAELKRTELAASLLQPATTDPVAKAALASVVQEATQSSSPILTLADNGQARFRIHVNEKTDIITLNAAAELADYLKKISGGEFLPLSNDANVQAGPLLIIGRDSKLTELLHPDIPYDMLGKDGFVIRTVGIHVIIAGATPRGTMYGVNWFLDRKLGVKWLSPSYTYVPVASTLKVPRPDEHHVPRFSYREVLSHEGQDKFYRAHNLLNGESHGPSFSSSPPEIDSWEHHWLAKGGYANFFELLPQKKYGKDHPEWYAGGQLAMMNPLLRQTMAGVIINRLTSHPNYRSIWFNIHDMDWGWDMDPASKAFADEHGGNPSAPRLDMMIDVADQVRKVLPEAKFAFNAYHWSFTPPKDMKVPEYILVFPMTIHVDYSSPLNEGRNVKLGQDIANWNVISKNVLVWDHITNFSGYYQPTPNIYPIGSSIQWLATLPNVIGYFAEGSWDTPAAEFSSLRAWMISRLLWNPAENVASLVSEYCQYYFGAAGTTLLRYINLMHAAIGRSGDMLGEKTQIDLTMFDLDFVVAADKLFDEAEAAVATDPLMLAHVKEARMPVDYVILVRRKEYADEAARRGILWKLDVLNRLVRFKTSTKSVKLRQYRQGGGMEELTELLDVKRHTPESPVMFWDLPATDWRVFQDLSFNRYDSARIVQDSKASDGAAVRIRGNSSTWAVQFKLDKLPKDGEWDLYADVRVDATSGHDREEGARVGAYPPMSVFKGSPVGELNTGIYQLIKVPGGPFRHDPEHGRGMYVQAPNQKYIKYVYVDRLVAVRVKT